jgi:hypothetical protein
MSAGFTFRSIPRLKTLLSAPQGFLQELTQSRAKNGEAPKPVLIMLHVRQSRMLVCFELRELST